MEAKVGQGRRRWLLNIATVWIALGPSSCAYFTDDGASLPAVESLPSPPVVMATPPVPRPSRKPPAPPLRVPRPKATPPAAEDEAIEPNRLIGLDENDTARRLGEPDQRTDASPATIWRYLTRDCQVDMYFYLDMQTAVRRALHFDVTSDYIDEGRSERCFKQIVDEHRRRNGSPTS
jgi:hypothetical protein